MRHGDISNRPAEYVVFNMDSLLVKSWGGWFKKPELDIPITMMINTLSRRFDYHIVLVTFRKKSKRMENILHQYVVFNELMHFPSADELMLWLDVHDIHNYIDTDPDILGKVFPRGILYSNEFKDILERLV